MLFIVVHCGRIEKLRMNTNVPSGRKIKKKKKENGIYSSCSCAMYVMDYIYTYTKERKQGGKTTRTHKAIEMNSSTFGEFLRFLFDVGFIINK